MKKLLLFSLIFLMGFIIHVAVTPSVLAQGWTQGQEAVSSGNTGLPETSAKEVVLNILKWLLGLVFVLTVFAFVGSGVMFIMSFSNSGIINMAKDWLTYAIIGLVVSVLGFVIVLSISNILRGDLSSVQGRGGGAGGTGRGGIFSRFFNIWGRDNNGNSVGISNDGNGININGSLGNVDFSLPVPISPGGGSGNNSSGNGGSGDWVNPDTGQPYDYDLGR